MRKTDKRKNFLVKLALGKKDFYTYCQLKAKDFYKPNRRYLRDFCGILQAFYESEEKVLVVNMPPRHGKSRTAGLFVEWVLGRDNSAKIMVGSYNERLSGMFSKNIRNSISETKADFGRVVYSDVFPGVRIRKGDGAMKLWSLEGGFNNFLATSPSGTATGFGCSLLLIDDLIKNSKEAHNEAVLDKHWDWFKNTMLSRLEENGKIIIIMTRWASGDLAGRALAHYRGGVRHVLMKAMTDKGSMLCEEILSERSYSEKIRAMGPDIASANYQQEPIDLKGRLYSSFKTYQSLPAESGNSLFSEIKNYTDTADEGSDYLCSINYGVYEQEAYVLDVLYTNQAMEVTEPATAKMIFQGDVNSADIESNNGGRGFARAVEKVLKEEYKSNKTRILPFHQSKNKRARILSNATWVMDHVYFPVNWADRWPEYHKAMSLYQREGKNKHDDAPDATTGIAEKIGEKSGTSVMDVRDFNIW